MTSEPDEHIDRCDYCRLPISMAPVELEYEGDRYEFCSAACRDALTDSKRMFTEYHGHRRFNPGVSILSEKLPQGIPRNSFVLLSDLPGTRSASVQAELAWRALQRDEPVVMASFLEPPVSLIQTFVTLDWNVLPYLEAGQLHIVDCFTYRVEDRERMFSRMNDWNQHLSSIAQNACTRVRDPSEMSELQSRLDSVLEASDMHDAGIVIIDSLTELGTLVQPVQAYNLIKNVRADICKGRFVPIFAGATVSGDGDEFPHDLEYMVDGIIDMNLSGEIVEGTLIKRLRIRNMSGVVVYPEWTAYEYTSGQGIVPFDPREELEGQDGSGDAKVDASAGQPADTNE